MTTPSRKTSFWFALWGYLNQPVFDKRIKFEFNPAKFTVGYRSDLLERCWTKDYNTEQNRQQLETCWETAPPQDERRNGAQNTPTPNHSQNTQNTQNDPGHQLSDRAASE